MRGMHAEAGAALEGIAHLRQSVRDILATPIGARVMRRDYGSRVPALIDAPITRALAVHVFAAVAEALERWEPRLALTRVAVADAAPGRLTLDLEGVYLPDAAPVRLEGLVV